MADDLGDEWWLPNIKDSKDVGKKKTESVPKKKSTKEKRKSISTHQEGVPAKKLKKISSESDSLEKTKKSHSKKKKRRKITDTLTKTPARPLQCHDLIQAVTSYFEDLLPVVELDEATLSESDFFPCRDLSVSTAEYLESLLPRWNKHVSGMDKSSGAPLMLIVCSAATRAVDVIRDLKTFHYGKCKVAKLFAKHMKVQEQTKFLQKSVIHIGVGTPNRIISLLDNGSLHLDKTLMILMDWSWRDAKMRRLIDIKDIQSDLMTLLQKHLVPRVKNGHCRFALM